VFEASDPILEPPEFGFDEVLEIAMPAFLGADEVSVLDIEGADEVIVSGIDAAHELIVPEVEAAYQIVVPNFVGADEVANPRIQVVDTAVVVDHTQQDAEEDQQRRSPLYEDRIHCLYVTSV